MRLKGKKYSANILKLGAVGLIKNTEKQLTNIINKNNNQDILIIGETTGHLECSIYAKEIEKNRKRSTSDGKP